MLSENTRKFIADLKAAGLDTSSMERQIALDPIAERQADHHIGGGILRQSDYTRYMNSVQQKEKQLEQQVNQLASLHDAQNAGVQLPQETLDAIKAMEDALIATGEFEESSIKTLSNKAISGFQKANKPQPQVRTNQDTNPNLNLDNGNKFVPTQDLSKFVDVNTMQAAMANLAYGDIATNLEIQAAMDEVRDLGIKIDRASVQKLRDNLRNSFEKSGTIDDAFEATFELSKIRETKNQEAIENRIKEETDKRVAEELKTLGVPMTKKFNSNRRHPIFDRKRETPANIQTPKADVKADEGNNIPPVDNGNNKLPVNKFGDTEIFRGRRSREERMQGAIGVHEKVMEHYADDITYVE